ncbi:hypothetical protein [Pelagibacterium lentulum]|uniref:Uncharacterized protein n=1 Tax=Pelagibacterium lentulum TaxID=2029865 RepID=A0A916R5Q5_9HYPH|nr:hypothetical protein [Pelagibacterium lentulum]GGA37531.1 hypothetical protein GCM10011499_03620 [Pelagibacterium lentulum]
MAKRVPLIDELPNPARLALIYGLALAVIGVLVYAGLAFENIGLLIAGVFGASFWLFSFGFAIYALMRPKKEKRQ